MGVATIEPRDLSATGSAHAALSRAERAALGALGLLALFASARVLPADLPFPFSALEAEAAWVLAPAWLLLVVGLARRWRRARFLAAIVCFAHVCWTLDWVPRAMARTEAEPAHALRVVSANLLAPRPSVTLARELDELDADVLILQELSVEWAQLLEAEGISARYPHQFLEPHPTDEDYFGIGIYSRHPITGRARIDLAGVPMLRADLDLEGAPLRVYSVHAVPPYSGVLWSRWRAQMRFVSALLHADVEAERAFVLGGDLNTSPATRAYRELLCGGVRSAHEEAFRGLATTWPNGGIFLAPPMRLDHILVHGVGVSAVREGQGEGSDHLPVIADLYLTEAP